MSHGSFYRYFENKEDFFRVLAEEASTRMVELLDAFPLDEPEPELRAWLEEWFATYESNGGVISTWQEMQSAGAELVSFGQEVAANVVARLMALLEERGFGDPLVDALALLAVVERLPYSVYTLGSASADETIDAMVTIIRRGVPGSRRRRAHLNMDFEFTDDQLDLRDNARKVLESTCPPSLVRSVFDGDADGTALWAELVALDWPGLGLPEEHGGLGLGFLEVGILVEELGRVVAPSPFLATVTQLAPLLREAGSSFLLADVAAGRTTGSLASPKAASGASTPSAPPPVRAATAGCSTA